MMVVFSLERPGCSLRAFECLGTQAVMALAIDRKEDFWLLARLSSHGSFLCLWGWGGIFNPAWEIEERLPLSGRHW